MHLRASLISKNFPGVIPRTTVKGRGKGGEGRLKGCVMAVEGMDLSVPNLTERV